MAHGSYRSPICKIIATQATRPILVNSINAWKEGSIVNAFIDEDDEEDDEDNE